MICPRCHRTYEGETRCKFDGETLTNARRIDFVRAGRTRHIGAILGNRFQIKGFIGQGGTSRVYLAEDVNTGEPVALKILEPPWAHDRVARERFLQEATAATTIDHPGVARILFVGQRGDGTPYIAMEFLFGETLHASLDRQSPMDPDVALPVLRETALTLQAAHEKGVIHRDVKPENIFLLGEPGDPYAVRLVDFGFAKLRDSTITAAGTAIGTVGFMAPEQCVADEVDARTDVYALGVVAYRMLTGILPFAEAATDELLAQQLIAAPPPSELEPGIASVIDRCLRKDPRNRYQSMDELRADIEAVNDGRDPRALHLESPTSDTYTPRGPFSLMVARALYRKLSVPMPRSFGA